MSEERIEITKGDQDVELPPLLAALLIKHRGWKLGEGEELPELPEPVFNRSDAAAVVVEEETVEVAAPVIIEPEPEPEAEAEFPVTNVTAGEINNEAACDDDLPEGVVFAESAYTTIVDKETGEKIRVLKTHCVNKHEYAGENVKIRVRDGKAYRECQTCLKARRARANAKEKAERAAVKAPAKKAPAKKAAK